MKLLEAANVNPPVGTRYPLDGRWSQGYNASSRSCSMQIEIEDVCGLEGNTAIVGTVNTHKGCYWVQPVVIRNFLRQSTKVEQPDDKDWFRQAVPAKLEYVAGGYLVKEYIPAVATWIGDSGVQSVSLPGTSAAQYRTAVAAAYALWQSTVVDPIGEPIMHVPPSLVADLAAANIVTVAPPTSQAPVSLTSQFSPTVVSSPGYDLNAKIFFTGEVIVRVSGIDDEGGPLYQARLNNATLSANMQLAVDVAPCSIVRVG